MHGSEERRVEKLWIEARGDANVAGAEAGCEGVGGFILTAAVEVVPNGFSSGAKERHRRACLVPRSPERG